MRGGGFSVLEPTTLGFPIRCMEVLLCLAIQKPFLSLSSAILASGYFMVFSPTFLGNSGISLPCPCPASHRQ